MLSIKDKFQEVHTVHTDIVRTCIVASARRPVQNHKKIKEHFYHN